MKRLVICLVAFVFSAAAHGQGKVFFANKVEGIVNAPVFLLGTPFGPGPNFSAQLFLSANGSLNPLVPVATFGSPGPDDSGARYWIPETLDVPVQPGTDATFVVRAWLTSAGSYDATVWKGASAPFVVTVGGGSLPPANLTTLKSFPVGPLPEPSTIALSVLGAIMLGAYQSGRRI